MKKLLAVIVLLFGASLLVKAQSGTVALSAGFTFNAASQITTWNGSDPANPPYADMGAVSLNTAFGGGWGSSIDVPFELGFLNNGYLADCNPIVWGQKAYTVGDGTHTGDQFIVPGDTTCPYYTGEYGTYENSNNLLVGWGVIASYSVTKHTTCRYGRCTTYYTYALLGGTGTVSETTISQ